jgi:hypothetical protein
MKIICKAFRFLKYLIYLALIQFFTDLLVPSINLGSNVKLFQQTYMNTIHLDLSKVTHFILTNLLGLYCLRTPKLRFKTCLIFILLTIVIGLTSSTFVLLGEHDYEGFCSKINQEVLDKHKSIDVLTIDDGKLGYFVYRTMVDIQRGIDWEYFTNFYPNNVFITKNYRNDCVFPFYFERFTYKYIIYTVPYFLTILTPVPKIANKRVRKLLNAVCYIFIAANVLYRFIHLYFQSIYLFLVYLGVFVLFTSGTVIQTMRLRKIKRFHPKLYYLLILAAPFVSIHCIYYSILLAISAGVITIAASKSFPSIWAYPDEKDMRTPVIELINK